MKRYILIVSLTILFLICLMPASTISAEQPDDYIIADPYTYPVMPGTSEWELLNMDERIALSHVDKEIVENMTTEAVLITTLRYPFIVNIFAYGTVNEGIDAVKGYCPPLAELLQRDDALQAITLYLNTAGNTESMDCFFARKLWTYISASTVVVPRYGINPITGGREAQVVTPNGSVVLVIDGLTWDNFDTTYEEQSEVNDWLRVMYGAVLLRDINPSYNCHSYAWYRTAASNHFWMNNPFRYIADGSYIVGTGVVGNKITYNADDGSYIHSGIVTDSGKITSKWGALGLFEHTVAQCPYYVEASAICYWQRA